MRGQNSMVHSAAALLNTLTGAGHLLSFGYASLHEAAALA
jgi:hypothetical protein